MKIATKKNIVLQNSETKPFLADAIYPETSEKLPLVIFIHGYKGYKDWGAWNLMAKKFAEAGFFFVKFNFSHNGTTLENTTNFADLEAFGNNNYSKELSDYEVVIDEFSKNPKVDAEKIYLIGHSRGGGVSVLKTAENPKIKKLVLLASVSDLYSRFPSEQAVIDHWKNENVVYVKNARTGQDLPHFFQFYEDFMANKERFRIENACKNIEIPALILHGTNDESVDYSEAESLHSWLKNSELISLENGAHSFGTKEPWETENLPADLEKVIKETIEFLKKE